MDFFLKIKLVIEVRFDSRIEIIEGDNVSEVSRVHIDRMYRNQRQFSGVAENSTHVDLSRTSTHVVVIKENLAPSTGPAQDCT